MLITSLTHNLEISFVSDRFFSKLAKYLLFFSSCSTMLAFDRKINPLSLVSVNCSNVFFFFIKIVF